MPQNPVINLFVTVAKYGLMLFWAYMDIFREKNGKTAFQSKGNEIQLLSTYMFPGVNE